MTCSDKTETNNVKLETCSGAKNMTSRVAKNLKVASVDDNATHQLPPIIECDAVPDNLNEIATPEIVTSRNLTLKQRYCFLLDVI